MVGRRISGKVDARTLGDAGAAVCRCGLERTFMTAGELIRELATMPAGTPVFIGDAGGTEDCIDAVTVVWTPGVGVSRAVICRKEA